MQERDDLPRFSRLELTRRFEESYRELGSRPRWHCRRALRLLLEEPAHPRLSARPVLPEATCWEARVGDAHRLLFRPAGQTALILDVIRVGAEPEA